MIKLSFIILTWNSGKYIEKCFNSIMAKCEDEGIDYEIIAVDNGSTDCSRFLIEHYHIAKPDRFQLITLEENKGTTYPRNLGLNRAKSRHVCILDSDTEITGGDIKEVLAILDERSDMGIVAPRLMLDYGIVQNSVKRFPTLWHKLLKLPRVLLGMNTPNRDFYEDFPFNTEKEVDSAISACWFFRKDLIDLVGLLDEKIFYSPEDLDYCMRVRKAGKKILYYPALTILHHTQQISHKKPFSRTSLSHFAGLLYYYKKHGGWFSSRLTD